MRPEVERVRELKPCPSCGGLGWIIVPEWSLDRVDCPDCEGTGKAIGNIRDNPETLEVEVNV